MPMPCPSVPGGLSFHRSSTTAIASYARRGGRRRARRIESVWRGRSVAVGCHPSRNTTRHANARSAARSTRALLLHRAVPPQSCQSERVCAGRWHAGRLSAMRRFSRANAGGTQTPQEILKRHVGMTYALSDQRGSLLVVHGPLSSIHCWSGNLVWNRCPRTIRST